MKYCDDIIKEFNLPNECCSSCHEDADEYGYDLIGIYDENKNTIAQVCCRVANNYEEKLTPSPPHGEN